MAIAEFLTLLWTANMAAALWDAATSTRPASILGLAFGLTLGLTWLM